MPKNRKPGSKSADKQVAKWPTPRSGLWRLNHALCAPDAQSPHGRHPDRAEPLRRHVEALELSIESQPAFCLQNVRTLFEAAHQTIAPRLGVAFGKNNGFPDRMRGVIQALDFSIADHPEAAKINTTIAALLKGIDDTAVALAQLPARRRRRMAAPQSVPQGNP